MKRIKQISMILIMFYLIIPFSGCKVKIADITGTWNMTYYLFGIPVQGVLTFTGSQTEGKVFSPLLGEVGTYSVDGKTIYFTAQTYDNDVDTITLSAVGTIENSSKMSGTFSYFYVLFPKVNLNGTFEAYR